MAMIIDPLSKFDLIFQLHTVLAITYPSNNPYLAVSIAGTVIFSYVTVIPALISGYLWWRKSSAEIKLADTLSLYGYCLTLFIPISVSSVLLILI